MQISSMPIGRGQLQDYLGCETGVSDWLLVDQDMINGFADVTGDHQYIHTDIARAKETPFGGTIAHGYLTLSLVANLGQQTGLKVDGAKMALNYGVDGVRFLTPVRSGKRIRLRTTLKNIREKSGDRLLLTLGQVMEIEGEEKPALVSDSLVMLLFK